MPLEEDEELLVDCTSLRLYCFVRVLRFDLFNEFSCNVRNFVLTFSLLRYAALAAGVVGFSSSSESDMSSSRLELRGRGTLYSFFLLTPAFARRGRERATDTIGAAAAALSLDEEVSSEELVVVVVFLALRADIR